MRRSPFKRKDFMPPPPTKEELEAKAKYEEFWSDPCWTEPIHDERWTQSEIAAHMSKL